VARAVVVVKLRHGRAAVVVVRMQLARVGTVVRTGWLTSGPSGLRFFQFIQNWLNFKTQNGCLNLLQKFPIVSCHYIGIW
jgi:hypothetical protein